MAQAGEWYWQSARRGDARGQLLLACLCLTADGVPKRPAHAYLWAMAAMIGGAAGAEEVLARATRENDAGTRAAMQVKLGEMYFNGRDIPRNFAAAAALLQGPEAENDPKALSIMGLLYLAGRGVARDPAIAAEWFRRAAERGDTSAQFNLSVMYGKGEGLPVDHDESVRWCRAAALSGDNRAMYRMSFLHSTGQGVEKNAELALAWATLAAGRGNLDAVQTRAALIQRMSQDAVDAATQIAETLLEQPAPVLASA
jgi:hypothetical protein